MSMSDWLGLVQSQDERTRPPESPLRNDRQRIYETGWIALVGWTAGFLVMIYYAPQIIIATYLWAHYCIMKDTIIPFPIKADDIMHLIWLLFGFGGYSVIKK